MKKIIGLLAFLFVAPLLHAGGVTYTVTTSSFTYDSSLGTWLDGGVTRGLVVGIIYTVQVVDSGSGVTLFVNGTATLPPASAYSPVGICTGAITADLSIRKPDIVATLNSLIKATTTTQLPASAKVPSINGAIVTPP